MRVQVEKLGERLIIAIPDPVVAKLGISAESPLEAVLCGNALVIRPLSADTSLDELLAAITDENMHGDIDTGPGQGFEAW